jgi:hypothetical protein
MTNAEMTTAMQALGFTEGARDEKDPLAYADVGSPVTGLWYGHRVHLGQFQYVSLCSYLGVFVEAVFVVYEKKFNSRLKPQQTALFATLYRNLPDLTEAVAKKYEFAKTKCEANTMALKAGAKKHAHERPQA